MYKTPTCLSLKVTNSTEIRKISVKNYPFLNVLWPHFRPTCSWVVHVFWFIIRLITYTLQLASGHHFTHVFNVLSMKGMNARRLYLLLDFIDFKAVALSTAAVCIKLYNYHKNHSIYVTKARFGHQWLLCITFVLYLQGALTY